MDIQACADAMAHNVEDMSLSDFPEPILLQMLRHLEGAELAILCTQDRRLRQIASEQSLWQALALSRWPNGTADHHAGDWQQLYRHRACLPPAFISCIDRCHILTAQASGQQLRMNSTSLPAPSSSPAGSPVKQNVYGFSQRPYARIPGMLFDQVMQLLFSACLWRARSTSSSQQAALSIEMCLVKQDMAWWLNSKPEAVLAFVRRSFDLLSDWDMWGSGFSSWPEVLWRRSALAFVMELQLGPEAGVCPSVSARLQRELDRLDDSMRSVDAEGSCLATRRPEGLPVKHWWYSLAGQMSGSIC